MREINCNIIQDLLPSYMDQICSEDSRLLVEEHLAACEQCRAKLEMMRNTELTDQQGEQKKISHLKKVKKYYIGFILLVLFVIGSIGYMTQHYWLVGSRLFYVILPLQLTATYGLLPKSPISAKQTKISGVLIGISVLLIQFYFSVLFYWIRQIVRMERGPFGIPIEETGQYMDGQFRFMIVMQLGVFVLANILNFCSYRINRCIYGLSLTGIYLATGGSCILHNMATVETFYALSSNMTKYILLEGIIFSVAAYVLAKRPFRNFGNKKVV